MITSGPDLDRIIIFVKGSDVLPVDWIQIKLYIIIKYLRTCNLSWRRVKINERCLQLFLYLQIQVSGSDGEWLDGILHHHSICARMGTLNANYTECQHTPSEKCHTEESGAMDFFV